MTNAPAPAWITIVATAPRAFAQEVYDPDGFLQGVLLCTEVLDADQVVLSTNTEFRPGVSLNQICVLLQPAPPPLLHACPDVDRSREDPPHRKVHSFNILDQDETYKKWGWLRRDGKPGGRHSHHSQVDARLEAWLDYDTECTPALYAERAAIADGFLAELTAIQAAAHDGLEGSLVEREAALRDVGGRAKALVMTLRVFRSP
jgi:hypothetical protein